MAFLSRRRKFATERDCWWVADVDLPVSDELPIPPALTGRSFLPHFSVWQSGLNDENRIHSRSSVRHIRFWSNIHDDWRPTMKVGFLSCFSHWRHVKRPKLSARTVHDMFSLRRLSDFLAMSNVSQIKWWTGKYCRPALSSSWKTEFACLADAAPYDPVRNLHTALHWMKTTGTSPINS